MKKSITIVGWRRPSFMNQMLEYLVKNDLSGWDIYVGLDPHKVTDDEHRAAIQRHVPQAKVFWRDWNCHLKRHHAISRNTHDIINKAYSNGSEYNIHLEDDVIVSPDITQLADWYGQNEFNNIFCLCFPNVKSGQAVCKLDTPARAVVRSSEIYETNRSGLHGFAHCTRRREWFDFISASTFGHNGWDWGWAWEINHRKMDTLIPYVTRCDHLGTHGVHIKNHMQNARKGWGNHKIYDGVVKKEDFFLL